MIFQSAVPLLLCFFLTGAVFAEPSDVVFALWIPDVSFVFTARAKSEVAFHVVQEFRCLISLGESVLSLVRPPVVHLHHNLVVFHRSKHFSLLDEKTR